LATEKVASYPEIEWAKVDNLSIENRVESNLPEVLRNLPPWFTNPLWT
jgi:hypothetical protein